MMTLIDLEHSIKDGLFFAYLASFTIGFMVLAGLSIIGVKVYVWMMKQLLSVHQPAREIAILIAEIEDLRSRLDEIERIQREAGEVVHH